MQLFSFSETFVIYLGRVDRGILEFFCEKSRDPPPPPLPIQDKNNRK